MHSGFDSASLLMNSDEKNWPELFPADSGSARQMPDLCPIRSGSGSGYLNVFLGGNPFCVNCFMLSGSFLDESR